MKINVLIVDDHPIVREGLHRLLKTQADLNVVGEAGDGMEALKLAKSVHPDVILLDIAMPGLNGMETIRLLKDKLPKVQVVIFSMYAKENYVQQALDAGALGYVLKASSSEDILSAIRAAHRKEYFLSSKICADVIEAYLTSRRHKPTVRGYDLLSEREQQVFRFVVEGKSTKEIADILCLSSKTIEKHRGSIAGKLGVHGRLEMLKYAIKIGVLDPELWSD